ncbi:MAG TPA: FGGY family carbohydrate kinase [Acidimicrobiales bacterium]|nr:FGGY family carbohydrate kinase [Acidimicrobiales bacterium]
MGKRALALDLGTSSVRAIVFEQDGPASLWAVDGAIARRARHLRSDEPGQATFEADDYLSDLVACIDELHGEGFLQGIDAVAIDSQWHSIVPVDGEGKPLGELLSWADTRPSHPLELHSEAKSKAKSVAQPEAKSEAEPADRLERLRQRTGCAFAPMYWTYRAPWLAARGAAYQVARFLGLPEYVALHLLDDPSTSLSMASGTGLLNTADMQWDDEAMEIANVSPQALPPIVTDEWRGRLSSTWGRRWPELAEVPWFPSLGDGAAANLGIGCDKPGWAAVTIGTSAAVRSVRPARDRSPLPPGLWRYRVDAERVVLGAAYSSGGQLYSWALGLWEGTSAVPAGTGHRAVGAARGAPHEVRYDVPMPVGAGSQGVIVLPWHAGTRPPAPGVPGGQGCVVGLGLGHTGAHIVSAAVEAVCFQIAQGLEDLASTSQIPLEVVANGGALDRSEWWRQRLASTLDRRLHFLDVPETTARGAARVALGADLSPSAPDEQQVVPIKADVDVLNAARKRWEQWYQDVRPLASAAGEQGRR